MDKKAVLDFSTNSDKTPKNEVVAEEKDSSSSSIDGQFSDIMESLGGLEQSVTQIQNKIKTLEKQMKKDQKNHIKLLEKKNKGNRNPSGFAKPSAVSDELCEFMNREKGARIARTEVTQYIIKYIKEQQLQDNENKRKIVPNSSLKELLGVNESYEVTFFNLQRLMNRHFI